MNYLELIKKQLGKQKSINDYLSVKGDYLCLRGQKLIDWVDKFGSPLEVAFTPLIVERVNHLKGIFKKAIKKHSYPGRFFYAYATKANYYAEVVASALRATDTIETTSSYDLDIVENLYNKKIITANTAIICNGFKKGRYFEKIVALKRAGLKIIPILESVEEVLLFLEKTELPFDVGLRFKVDEASVHKFEDTKRLSAKVDSRFGLTWPEIKSVAKMFVGSKVFHLHIGGMMEDPRKAAGFYSHIFDNYFVKLKKIISSLSVFDLGGGLPVQYDLKFSFDYQKFADLLVELIGKSSKRNNMVAPDIIGEYGRYTVNDHGFFIFDIEIVKPGHGGVGWYLVNGSLMNLLPDSWALGQSFLVLPLEGWKRPYTKVKLGGMTCDPDDTYFKSGHGNFIYLPQIRAGEKLHIGFFGIGAYQEMISGVGGVHHCLLPEGNELIVYKHGKKLKFNHINKIQSPKAILDILSYHRHHNLRDYLG